MELTLRFLNFLKGEAFCWSCPYLLRAFSSFAFIPATLFSGCGIGLDSFGTSNSSSKSAAEATGTIFKKDEQGDSKEGKQSQSSPTGVQEVVELDHSLSGKLLIEESERFRSVLQIDVKSYRSSNITRVESMGKSAAATEYTTIGRLEFPTSLDLLFFKTFTPSLTALGQRSYFGQYEIDSSDSTDEALRNLDYEFRSITLGGEGRSNSDWEINLSLEYDELLDFRSHDKLYHAIVSSASFGRDYSVFGGGILGFGIAAEYALTKIHQQYEVPGVFDDAGDNLRTALNLSLTQPLDSGGRFYLTPSASIMRTAYTKPTSTGRIDYLMHVELAAVYRIMPWLYLRSFTNYQDKTANEKAKALLFNYAEYNNWDAGLGLGVSLSF
ncbi:MAG: hypothetical protein HN494_17075 [Opitutae bacterium]|jgi:hypothetical protein|nr:hypothetical protein [Opitutae bacterium]MBT4667802.1 hypothetical protein [Opitutae bacterium]MBT5910182.1 hypothetical protein [Opitutae bacterium]MBT6850024.1 hypothetical protein [Opitutae bacterium]MBT7740814.1 hypothetical protein [Opitutae bacterium]